MEALAEALVTEVEEAVVVRNPAEEIAVVRNAAVMVVDTEDMVELVELVD